MEAADAGFDAELAVEQDDTAEDTGTASEELQATGEVGWSQGQPAKGLGPTSDRVCFLTGLKGNFVGGGERVRVYASGGSWYLEGNSAHTGVGAWASCAYTAPGTYTGEYVWEAGQNYPTSLGSASGRVCFFTRLSGGFNSTKEWVHIYASGGTWFMTGETGGPVLRAGARCVSVPSDGGQIYLGTNEKTKYMGPIAGKSCGLVKLVGTLNSGSDYVHCDRTMDSWYLTGQATSGPLGVGARLF